MVANMLTIDLLKRTDLSQSLSPECLDAVYSIFAKKSFSRTFEPGEILIRKGDPFNYLLIVESGLIKSFDYTTRGELIFFYYFSQYHIAGLVSCTLGSNASSDYVANQKTTITYIPRESYLSACRLLPEFQGAVLKRVCKNAERQIEISILSRCKYAKDRLCLWLFHQYTNTRAISIPIEFTIESLSNYLGLTRTCLSKELHTLEAEGVISLSRKEIQIKDLETLKKYI